MIVVARAASRLLGVLVAADDELACQCGHEGFNHSDVSPEALGACYVCDCPEFEAA